VTADWAYNNTDHYYHISKPARVDVTGANYLFKREVYDAGVRYGFHSQGEDVYWCERAQEAGFELYCDATLRPQHILNSMDMNKILKLPPGVSVEMPRRDQHLVEVDMDSGLDIIEKH
jgi:hypothetical protein